MSRIIAILFLLLLSPILVCISLYIIAVDGLPILYRQRRPGLNHELFTFYKFRSMRKDTPEVATHLLSNPEHYRIPGGHIMRKLSLDELPNLINVVKGEMVFIGPRPALHNQYDLIKLRSERGIDRLRPGITGWAQVNGRDSISIDAKVKLEEYYLHNQGLMLNAKIVYLTLLNVVGLRNISH